MATAENDNTILTENAIFESDKYNELVCSICMEDTTVKDWRKHIESPCHIGTLQRFNLVFERRDSTVTCKVCDKELSWDKLKTHAYWHMIVPWYQPVDRYKRFFENQIQEWETQFYCYPCDIIFREWSTTFVHIAEAGHQSLIIAGTLIIDSASFNTPEILYQLLVSEGFIFCSAATVKCRICDCPDLCLQNIFSHIRGPLHLELKSKFVSTLKERYKKEIVGKQRSEYSHNEESTSENQPNDVTIVRESLSSNSTLADKDLPCNSSSPDKNSQSNTTLGHKSLFCIYIIQQNATNSYCKLCDVKLIGRSSIEHHVTSSWHTSTHKKYSCDKILSNENNNYYCECCRCTIPDLENLHDREEENGHARTLFDKGNMATINEIPVETPKQPDNASHPTQRGLAHDYITKLNNADFCCTICNVLLSDMAVVDDHIAGELHKSTLKRYGCDRNITLIDGKKYHCGCCDFVIPSVDDICMHVTSSWHQSFLKPADKQVPVPSTAIVVKPVFTELPEDPQSAYYMIKLSDTEVHCKICDIVLFGRTAVNDHTAGAQHAMAFRQYGCYDIVLNDDDSYYCKTCKCKIYIPERMLFHIMGSVHTKYHAKSESNKFPVGVKRQSLLTIGSQSLVDDFNGKLNNGEVSPNTRVLPPNATVLSQYGCDSYISSIGGDKYHCKSCNCKIPSSENIYGHITGSRHQSLLKNTVRNSTEQPESPRQTSLCYYIVKLNATNFHCQVCDRVLSAQTVNDHATGEQHAASLQRYGCHKISLTDGINYWCQSCQCKIPGLANVFLHMKGTRHKESLSEGTHAPQKQRDFRGNKLPVKFKTRQQLQDTPQTAFRTVRPDCSKQSNDSLPETRYLLPLSQTPVKDRATEESQATAPGRYTGDRYITSIGDNKYYCKCCDCVIPSTDNIYEHTTGSNHRSFLQNSTDQPVVYGHSSHCRYIVKLNDNYFNCVVCSLPLSDEAAMKDHAAGEQHAMALKRYGCQNIWRNANDSYYCKFCECPIPNLANVYVHIKGNRHTSAIRETGYVRANLEEPRTNINPIKVKTPNQSVNGMELACQTVPLDYIVQFNDTEFVCKICNVLLTGQKVVNDHLAGKLHATARDQYGCDNISSRERGKYHCGCCNCEIPNLENVYRHVKGRNHFGHVSSNRGIPTAKYQTSETADVNKVLSFPVAGPSTVLENMDPERTKNAEKLSFCNSAIGQQQKSILTRQVPCSVSVASPVKLQSQLASSIDGNLDSSAAEKNLIEKMKNYLMVNKVKQNLNEDSQLTSISEERLAIRDTKVFSESVDKSLRVDDASDNINTNGPSSKSTESKSFNLGNNLASPASSQVVSTRSANSGRKPRAPRKTNVQKVIEVFDCDIDYIHDMEDKLKEIKIGMKLCFANDAEYIYCLVCRSEVEVKLENYMEHLGSLAHCENFEGMQKDHALFEIVPGQSSDFDLALQYMEEITEDRIRCFICHEEIENIDSALQSHIEDTMHERRCKEMEMKTWENFENIKSRAQCDWYKIHKYRCEICSANFQSEFSFAKHLKCISHANVMKISNENEGRLIYDFCASCSLLWYGCQSTYAHHCDSPTHKWIMHDGHCVSPDLPKSAKLLLASTEEYIEATISYFDYLFVQERRKEKTLIFDVENAVKLPFPQAKIYIFGSRASGLSSPDSDIHLFIDYGNMYEGNESSEDRTVAFITSVRLYLSNDTQSWETAQLSTNTQANVPIIKAQHRATGLSCHMSFENGLCVENTKLIILINDTFPKCRKMILFLKQWLAFCDLSGFERISSYAICWYVIFFLQMESYLPSIATLIEMEKNSHIIAGWEVGVSRQFDYNEAPCSSSVKELLIRFFAYYASFDYRYDVACPLVGEVVKKRAFKDPQNLPKKMGAYLAYMRNSDDPEPFRIDSAVCIQDPFNLQCNLTKDVSKVNLSRFRIYCAKSRDLLCTS